MQGPNTSGWSWMRREEGAGERLPYRALVDEHTLLLDDGSLMVSLLVPGLPFETVDSIELNAHAATREVLLRSAIDARFVLYHHIVRRRVAVELDAQFSSPLAAHVDACWREQLGGGRLFVNDQFLTLVRRPARGHAGWPARLARMLNRRQAGPALPDPAQLRELHAAANSLGVALGAYGARLLGEYEGAAGKCSEPLELLSALYNGEMRPVRVPAPGTAIGAMLPYRRVSFGLDALELRGAGETGFAALLSLKDYPGSTSPGLADALLRLPCELVLSESYAPCDRQLAHERINLGIRRLRAADEDALAERHEMQAARDALGVGAVGFGDHHLSVLVRADRLDQLDAAAAACAAALADTGAIAVREDVNLEPAFWGQFPGNEGYLARRALISSGNMACFSSLHGFVYGQATGNHWGDAVTVLETTSATPYFFNFHDAAGGGDLGNFTVIGPSGSGKTVIMNFLAAQAQKFHPRLILFDKDRGAEIFLRALGARYDRIATGQPTGFNPLALPDSAANRAFLRDWLGLLLGAQGAEELATIARAVDSAYASEPRLRRLRYFRELLSGQGRPHPGDLASRLDPWVADGPNGAGEFGWLFDNPADLLDIGQAALGFDMTELLDAPRLRTPVMMYLFHRIEERLDGRPTMIVIDEGWKALDDDIFAARIRDWLKTLRKRNALVGFATQSARDALDSRIATALVEQTATMVFTPNARARAEDYCDGFGLTRQEFEIVRGLPAYSHCFLVRQANASVVVRLDLSGAPEVLRVLSGQERAVRRLDELRALCGDDPAAWYPALIGAPWPGGWEAGADWALPLATEAAE